MIISHLLLITHTTPILFPSLQPFHTNQKALLQSFLAQITTDPDDRIASAVDHAAHNANALQSPAGLETGIVIIDTIAASVGSVQSALEYAESLKGALDCLAECAGYLNGVIGLCRCGSFILPLFSLIFSSRIRSILY
jgi:NAD(P)-dependent dehydrogenase (short-subunit alcohol dehydrogenase family)